jgi:hypothetical protein
LANKFVGSISYCWNPTFGPAICVDTIESFFDSATALPAGAPIRLQLDKPLPNSVTLSLSEEVFGDAIVEETLTPAAEVVWSPTVAAGDYIHRVSGSWKEGDVTTWFSISLP